MPRLGSRVRAPLSAPSHASGRFSNRPFSYRRRSGQVVRQRPAKPLPPVRIRASPPDRPRGPPKGGPLFVRGTQIRAVPAARCGEGVSRCGGRGRGAFPAARRPARIRALFQMEQEIPFGTGPRRSKWDFLLHLGFEPLLRAGFLSRLLGVVAIGQGKVCPLCINCEILHICGLVIHC